MLFEKNLLCSAPTYLTDGDDEDGEDEDGQGHPGYVGFEAPGLCKASPTFIHARGHFRTREDENLRSEEAEQQRQYPGQDYEGVPALRGHAAVRQQRAADSVVTVHCHGHDHVGGGEHPEHLKIQI